MNRKKKLFLFTKKKMRRKTKKKINDIQMEYSSFSVSENTLFKCLACTEYECMYFFGELIIVRVAIGRGSWGGVMGVMTSPKKPQD